MNRLDFDCPFDLADTITALLGDIDDDYPVISVYGKYDVIKDILEDLIMSGVSIANEIELQDYDVEDLKATLKTVEITKFDEDILLEIIKPLGIEGIIKTREYVDMDALETAIYKGMLDAKILEKSRIITEQKKFSVKMMKLKKEI